MRRRTLAISLALVSLVFFDPIGLARAQQAASPKRASPSTREGGKKLFDGNCAGCHGLDARGGEHAPNVATNPKLQHMSDEQLFRIVHDGAASGAMPAFGSTLPDGKIQAVVAYLRSLQGHAGGPRATLPGDPAAGQLLFFGKAACSQCHTVVESGVGSGGFIATDLTGYAAAREPSEILRAITNTNENLNPRARTAVIVTQDGQKLTGFIRNQDNFSIQFQSLDGTFHLFERLGLASITYDSQSLMPDDYSQRLTPAELNDLVSFLMRAAAAESASTSGNEKKRDDDGGD